MKNTIAFLFFIVFVVVVLIWINRGYRIGKKEIDDEKRKEIKGRVLKIYKPSDEKIIHIVLSNGTEYAPSFFGLNNIVKVGDSIYKAGNSLKFIIYKQGVVEDSVSYEATNSFYK